MATGFLTRAVFFTIALAGMIGGLSPYAHAEHMGPWNPPARFDHAYSGKLIERELPRSQVLTACKKLFARYGFSDTATRGCSVETVVGKECTIIYANRTYHGTTPAETRRHEIGHCNGWPADHPN